MSRARSFLSKLFAFKSRCPRPRKPRHGWRPAVEALEDRTVPAVFNVNTALDTIDVNLGDGLARDANGNTSLRAAVMEANALVGADTINLPAGTYALTRVGTNEDLAVLGDLDVTDNLTLVGANRDSTTISGQGIDRVFHIRNGARVTPVVSISQVTITNGRAPDVTGSNGNGGGGVLNEFSTLTLNNTVIRNNRSGNGAFGGDGGGVYTVLGTTTIANSIVTQNVTGSGTQLGGDGGGVASLTSSTTIRDSVISDNRTGDGGPNFLTAGDGGGIYSASASDFANGVLTVLRTTVSGNAVGTTGRGDGGGIITHDEGFVLDSSVVANNTAWRAGGVEIDITRSAQVVNSTIAGNTATGGGAGGIYHTTSFDQLITGTTFVGTTVSGNQAPNSGAFDGGGGMINQGQIASIINSTFSGNSTNTVGGGIANYRNIARIVNVTIANNTANDGGGLFHMLFANSVPVIGEMTNTVLADNTAGGTNAKNFKQLGLVTTAGNNIVEDGVGHSLLNGVNGNIVGVDPLLGALADNGGPTRTHALLAGSVAINAGTSVGAPTTDQRGQPRPIGPAVDIGAFEAELNQPPIANNQSRTTDEDTALNGTLTATDPDGNPLTYALVAGPAHGTVTLNAATGAYTYTPDLNYNGSDSFTFKANDGLADSNVATVSITVNPVNDAPVADDQAFAVDEDVVLQGQLVATDVEGNTLTYTRLTNATNGVVSVQANGRFIYIPRFNFNGTDTFTFRVSDGTLTDTATVIITVRPVNDAPFVDSPTLTTPEDQTLSGSIEFLEVEGDPVTFTLLAGSGIGSSVTVNPDGSFTYTPVADFNGTDAFTFRASDDKGAFRDGTVTIRVTPVNDAPVANDDQFSVNEDETLTLDVGRVSGLFMVSEPGDFVGAGLTYNYTPANATFSADQNFDNGVSLSVLPPDTFWFLDFAAPFEQPLEVGFYANAMRFPFQDADRPGLAVFGDGRGLNQLVGEFTVQDVEYGPDDTVVSFAATFVQQGLDFDGTVDPPLRGTIQFNTKVGAGGGVLANDTDVDGDRLLTALLVNGPAHGALTLNRDGTLSYTPDDDFHGTDTFTYRTSDGQSESGTATVTITVNPVNDAPVADDQSVTTPEDQAVSFTPDTEDVDGDPLTFTVVTSPTQGAVVVNSDGTFTYTPGSHFNGTDSFTYTANDGSLDSNVATLTITVTPVNDAPVAQNDAYSTSEETPLNVPAPGVLANDTDVEGNALTAVLVTGPANGTLTLNPDGSFTYTPTDNFNGTDSFTYVANDGLDDSNIATVTITINAVNDAPVAVDDSYTVDEDNTLTISAPGLLGNDTDGDSTTLTASVVNSTTHGSLTLNSDGSFTYTPNDNFNGTDSFTYKVNDGELDSNIAIVTITVNAVNDAPVAVDDSYTVDEDGTLTVSGPGVLGNDTDGDSTILTATLVSTTTNGSLTLNSDGSFTYTPNRNFNGTDSFAYVANDGELESETTTVTITVNAVNDAPVANHDDYSVDEDTTLTVSAPGVLGNDTDGDSMTLTATVVTNTINGILSFNSDGSFTYTPNSGFIGTDSFTYVANDGSLDSEVAMVTISVIAVNDTPVANPDAYVVDEDNTLTVGASAGVLLNDTDGENNALTAVLVSTTSNGTLTLNADGSFTYTPTDNFNGTDSFTYQANDGADHSNVATVTITVRPVNDAPVSREDSYITDEDTALKVEAPGVLANDTDVEGDSLKAVLVTGPANGTLTLNADGSFTYTPTDNFNGTDSFTYQANDDTAEGSTTTVSLTVRAVNDVPLAVADAYSVAEDNQLTVGGPGVLANDSDTESGGLRAILVSTTSNGTLVLNEGGSFTYTPNSNFHGTDSFTYRANDGELDSSIATVTIQVTAVNDAPLARDDSYATTTGTTLIVATPGVLGNDSDVDGVELTSLLVSGPAHGTLTLNADGSFTYTPNAGFTGTDSFSYRASDGSDLSNVATVTLVVSSANQPGVTFEPDPCHPGGVVMVVRGTSRNDDIDITRARGSNRIEVRIRSAGFFFAQSYEATFTRIEVHGFAGNDDIRVQDTVTLPAWLFGEEGHDHLQGGGGPGVLVGGDGWDFIQGGQGRSLLIGGRGSDLLNAQGDDSILIAGFTDHDANALALCAVMDEWTSGRRYSDRVANLADWLNDATVHDDEDIDLLFGGKGRDWFLASLRGPWWKKDRVLGARPNEIITDTTGW